MFLTLSLYMQNNGWLLTSLKKVLPLTEMPALTSPHRYFLWLHLSRLLAPSLYQDKCQSWAPNILTLVQLFHMLLRSLAQDPDELYVHSFGCLNFHAGAWCAAVTTAWSKGMSGRERTCNHILADLAIIVRKRISSAWLCYGPVL